MAVVLIAMAWLDQFAHLGRSLRWVLAIAALVLAALLAIRIVYYSRAVNESEVNWKPTIVSIAITIVLGGAYASVTQAGAVTHLSRVVMPGANIRPFMHTQVDIVGMGQRYFVMEGSPLTIKARTDGRPVDGAVLKWTGDDGKQQQLSMERSDEGDYACTLPKVDKPLTVFVSAGDGYSEPVEIGIDVRPKIEAIGVTYRYPKDLGKDEVKIKNSDGNLTGPKGTTAILRFRSNKHLEFLALNMEQDGKPVTIGSEPIKDPGPWADKYKCPCPLHQDTGGNLFWTARVRLDKSCDYRIRIGDAQGYQVIEPATYHITVN